MQQSLSKICVQQISRSIFSRFSSYSVDALNGADVLIAGMKIKLFNLDLFLKDNTQPKFQKCHHHHHHYLLRDSTLLAKRNIILILTDVVFLSITCVGRSSSLVRTLALRAKGRRSESGSAHFINLFSDETSFCYIDGFFWFNKLKNPRTLIYSFVTF